MANAAKIQKNSDERYKSGTLGKLKHKAGLDFGPLKLVGCEKCNEESVETGVKMKLSDGYEVYSGRSR